MSLLGIAYTFEVSTLWTAIGLVTRRAQIGTALSLATLAFNLFNFVVNSISGFFSFNTDLFVFMGFAASGVITVAILYLVDLKQFRVLNTQNSIGIFKDCDVPEEKNDEAKKLLQESVSE